VSAPAAAAVVLDDDVVPTLRQVIRDGAPLQRVVGAAIVFLSMFLAVLMLYGAVAGSITSYLQRLVFVWAIVSIGLLVRSAGGRRWHRRSIASLLPDVILIVVMTAGMAYVLGDYEEFSRRNGYPLPEDLFFGIVFLVATLEVTRRHLGWAMLLICLVFGLQALFGKHFPGMFAAPNVRWQTFVEVLFMQDQGMFGSTTAVAASYLMIFLIFGAMLVRTNGVEFFEKLSQALLGRRAGGPAHVSILSSALQGTTSGSVVGNVVGIGNVTIPLMMRSGFPPATAGAIEAVASSGGQIMPPVMGSAAFLMAGLLGVGYWTIVVAALIPALYYFIALHLQVEVFIRKQGIQASAERMPTLGEAMRSGGHLLLALIALIVPMFIGSSPQMSAFIGLVSLFVVSMLHRSTRITMVRYLESAIDAIANNVAVGAAVTTAGILMGTLWVSGAGNLLADFVVYASNGHLPIALVLTAVISLVLGMGLPTPDRGGADRAGAGADGGQRARQSYVRVLLWHPRQRDAAGSAGGLCRGQHRRCRPEPHRHGGDAAGHLGLRDPVRLRVQPGVAAEGLAPGNRAGVPRLRCRRRRAGDRRRGLVRRTARLGDAGPAARQHRLPRVARRHGPGGRAGDSARGARAGLAARPGGHRAGRPGGMRCVAPATCSPGSRLRRSPSACGSSPRGSACSWSTRAASWSSSRSRRPC
jgi:TRAP transporter 4TM/12TM fusion protein